MSNYRGQREDRPGNNCHKLDKSISHTLRGAVISYTVLVSRQLFQIFARNPANLNDFNVVHHDFVNDQNIDMLMSYSTSCG